MQTSAEMDWGRVCWRVHRRPGVPAIAAALLLILSLLAGLHPSHAAAPGNGRAALELTSSSFPRGKIPRKFTCDGEETSPALAWSAPPPSTLSFALFVTDPDAPGGAFVHWLLYDLPAEKRALSEGQSREGRLLDGSRQGRNDFDEIGYRGPCPPGRAIHHYVFTLYALDAKLDLPAEQTPTQIESAIKGHILARGELIVQYEP